MASEFTKTITVSGGNIRGRIEENICVYKGIPYAAPPVGDLRWRAPQQVKAWEGTRDCTEWADSPIQAPQDAFLMWTKEFIIDNRNYSEDCLYLNVWTADDDFEGKPVIVFFHGGNLVSGGTSCEVYDGKNIARRGAVYVSVGFRVGILGLLSSTELSAENDRHVSGNYMVLDQIEALKWVRDNIASFGGDPGNVTITGLSSGGNNVNALCISPLAKGLFGRAFAMSFINYGIMEAKGGWIRLEDAQKAGDAMISGRSLDEMRKLPAEEILKMSYPSNICIDGYIIKEDYTDAVNNGRTDDIDYIMGMVTGDGLMYRLIGFGQKVTALEGIEKIKEFFGPDAEEALGIYPVDEENPDGIFTVMGHDAMLTSLHMFARKRSARTSKNTYIYELSHVMPGPESAMYGAFHSSDMPYFWGVLSDERKEYWTDTDRKYAEELCGILVSYAKTGAVDGSKEWAASNGDDYCVIGSEGIKRAQMDERIRNLWVAAIDRNYKKLWNK